MDLKNIETLKNNIKKIEKKDKKTKKTLEIWENNNLYKFNISSIAHKYSNTKVPLYRFFYNENKDWKNGFIEENIITRNNYYFVTHKCINCDAVHCVALNNILRKINNNIVNCIICKEHEEDKKQKHNRSLEIHYYNKKNNIEKPVIIKKTLLEKLNEDKLKFDEYDTDFKDNYYRRNMDNDEFNYIRNKIISIQNRKFIISDDFIYYPEVSISNQTRFCSYLYSLERNNLEKIINIEFQCEICCNVFISKDLSIHKNQIKVLCKDCKFTNSIYKLRTYNNLRNESIIYQSKFELKFIRYCNTNKVNIINGPNIPYYNILTNKNSIYKVDFAIPKLNLLIEIKDNHHWHQLYNNRSRFDLTASKWNSKVNGVNNFINEKKTYNNVIYTKYIIIFPKNYIKECEKIINEYWKYETI